MREAAGLPSVKPDGTPYLRGPYKPRGSTASAATARKDTRKKRSKHEQRRQKRMVSPAQLHLIMSPAQPRRDLDACRCSFRRSHEIDAYRCSSRLSLDARRCSFRRGCASLVARRNWALSGCCPSQAHEGPLCVCGVTDDGQGGFIACSSCDSRFHPQCVGITTKVKDAFNLQSKGAVCIWSVVAHSKP